MISNKYLLTLYRLQINPAYIIHRWIEPVVEMRFNHKNDPKAVFVVFYDYF